MVKVILVIFNVLFRPFAGPAAVHNGNGYYREGNPTGYFNC